MKQRPKHGSGYDFDVFISYRRSGNGNACEWVHNHFHPMLRNCLADELPWQPRIFIDIEVETGSHWPAVLERALLRTKVLVTVWSPPYFRSEWCLAEWQSMQAREQWLGMTCVGRTSGLIYPVIFSDSAHFPAQARARQGRDLKQWSHSFPAYRDTAEYVEFSLQMKGLATELAKQVMSVPKWAAGWPVRRPTSIVARPSELPRI